MNHKPKASSEAVDVKAIVVEDVSDPGLGILLYREDGTARDLPVPSSNPNDPLNFGPWRHRLILAAVCMYGITSFGVIQSTPLFFGNLVGEYMQETRGAFDPARIVDLASYPSLCMGMGNFFFVPLSMALGRRSAFILSNALLLASIIWAAKSTSFSSHLGARCLQGLTAGISDCLLPIIVLEISFLHHRSSRLVAYWVLTAVGSSLLLIPVPFIVESAGQDWRVSYWFWAGFAAFSLLLVILCVPETLFQRQAAQLSGTIHLTDSYGTYRAFISAEEARLAGFNITDNDEGDGSDSTKKVSYASQFAPISVQKSATAKFIKAYRDIFLCLLVPGVAWALLFNSFVFGGLVILSLTYAQRLEMEPWHFSSSTVGTVQVGAAIGALFGLGFGELAEPISRFFTRRNGGTREPEHVLPNFILPSLISFLGLVVYGVVAAQPERYHWAGIHVAFGLFYFGFCAISAMTGVWLSELLPHMSGPAIILTCGGRNAVSFGYSHSFSGWLADLGFMEVYIMFGGILFALGCLCVPMFFVNRSIRKVMLKFRWLHI